MFKTDAGGVPRGLSLTFALELDDLPDSLEPDFGEAFGFPTGSALTFVVALGDLAPCLEPDFAAAFEFPTGSALTFVVALDDLPDGLEPDLAAASGLARTFRVFALCQLCSASFALPARLDSCGLPEH